MSVLNIRFSSSSLYTDFFGLGEQNVWVVVELELWVNDVCADGFDDVGLELTFQNFEEVPSDHKFTGRCDDACLFSSARVEIVEASWSEIEASDPVFGQIFYVNLQLERIWLLFAHSMFESGLTVWAFCWKKK